MVKRRRLQPNLARAAKAINKLVDNKLGVQKKNKPTRKVLRKQGRMEKKRHRISYQVRKMPNEEEEDIYKEDNQQEEQTSSGGREVRKKSRDGPPNRQTASGRSNQRDQLEISKLEKLMGMKPAKKRKKLPASFKADGLDYILDITEQLDESTTFEGKKRSRAKAPETKDPSDRNEDLESGNEDLESGNEDFDLRMESESLLSDKDEEEKSGADEAMSDGYISDGDIESHDSSSSDEEIIEEVSSVKERYVPPHLQPRDDQLKLKRSINGIINRLSTSNMSYAVGQVEKMFQSHSRNDMNRILTEVILEACLLPTALSSKFGMDHMMLVAVLHSLVGSEVGAYFLQTVTKRFDELHRLPKAQRDKCCYNAALLIGYLYNYLVVDSLLVYDIIRSLLASFTEYDVEILLMLLKNCGMQIRKESASSLKEIVQLIQSKSCDTIGSSRMQYMLEVITLLRTNNPRKIPGYDPDQIEHMRKLLRAQIKGGLGDNQLKISLEDLLNVDNQGRWWVVGSSWSGRDTNSYKTTTTAAASGDSDQQSELMALARRQRMNTSVRKTVFCIIMSSEDYVDAFEKLLKLSLKDTEQRELVHVTLHCCLQEKSYNPYYAFLGQRLCEFNRSHQVTFQFALWDKFRELQLLPTTGVENLCQMCSHLIINKVLSLSILRAVQFTQLDKHDVRFFTKLLRSLLIDYSETQCRSVFSRLAGQEHLKTLRDSLIFFLKHFLHSDSAHDKDQTTLNTRISTAIDCMQTAYSQP